MNALYNEIDRFCCDWLSNLMDENLITPGKIDDRSIVDLGPDDVAGFERVHFFAGIGTWDFVLSAAKWGDRPIWTGSCPCQPFSVAGARKGFADERDLWPELKRLIAKRMPPVIAGEQSANAAQWLSRLRSDLEALGYAVGAMPIEAASAGAYHYRDRYFFVADYDFECASEEWQQRSREFLRTGCDPENLIGSLEHLPSLGWGERWTEDELRSRGGSASCASLGDCQLIECPDGKWRPLPPPGVRWLGTGVSARVAKLRAIGNAIDWRPAAEFIQAFAECRP